MYFNRFWCTTYSRELKCSSTRIYTHIKCMHLFNFSFWARGTVRFYHYFLICAGCSYLTIQMAITNENFCTIYEFISMGGVVGTTGWSAFIWNETDLCNRMLNTYEHFEKNIDGSWSARKHAPPFKNEIFTTICGEHHSQAIYLIHRFNIIIWKPCLE